jgi:hypothetical protein
MQGYEPGDMPMSKQGGMQGGQQMQMGGGLDKDGCVLTCTVADCCYNQDLECYAQQITVGDDHPTCDTYSPGPQKQTSDHEGYVMNCKVGQCHFNQSDECHARGITVDFHAHHADCVTFRP